jgi:hypothetical protein
MFGGGAANPYDDIVGEHPWPPAYSPSHRPSSAAKTTDENLTSENWELILNLCDKVTEEGEEGCDMPQFSPSLSVILILFGTGLEMSLLPFSSDSRIGIRTSSSMRCPSQSPSPRTAELNFIARLPPRPSPRHWRSLSQIGWVLRARLIFEHTFKDLSQ